MTEASPARARLPELALLMVALLWGATFLVTRTALQAGCGPYVLLALRFGMAAMAGLPLMARRLLRLSRHDWIAAGLIAVPMTVGYILQTIGLGLIPSSLSAFLSALYVPVVPLLQLVLLRKPPQIMSWIGILLAFIGLIVIAEPWSGVTSLGLGGWLTLASAIAFAAEIILVGAYAERIDAAAVAVIDLALVASAALIAALAIGEPLPSLSPTILGCALGLGLASAFIQIAMIWAQRTVSPTRATLIYASEPVFAGMLGRFAGERIDRAGWLGAVLILGGVLVSELKPKRWRTDR